MRYEAGRADCESIMTISGGVGKRWVIECGCGWSHTRVSDRITLQARHQAARIGRARQVGAGGDLLAFLHGDLLHHAGEAGAHRAHGGQRGALVQQLRLQRGAFGGQIGLGLGHAGLRAAQAILHLGVAQPHQHGIGGDRSAGGTRM